MLATVSSLMFGGVPRGGGIVSDDGSVGAGGFWSESGCRASSTWEEGKRLKPAERVLPSAV